MMLSKYNTALTKLSSSSAVLAIVLISISIRDTFRRHHNIRADFFGVLLWFGAAILLILSLSWGGTTYSKCNNSVIQRHFTNNPFCSLEFSSHYCIVVCGIGSLGWLWCMGMERCQGSSHSSLRQESK